MFGPTSCGSLDPAGKSIACGSPEAPWKYPTGPVVLASGVTGSILGCLHTGARGGESLQLNFWSVLMSETIEYRNRVEVRHEVDVLVVGGGPSGMAAALAAARQGLRVHLVENGSCFGGMGTLGLVPAFMQFTDGVNFLADGIGREVLERLEAADGTGSKRRPRHSTSIRAEVLKRVYDEMAVEAGFGFTFHTRAVDVQMTGPRVDTVVCAAKSGLFAIRAAIVVDCSGDGDIAARAGADYEKGDAGGAMMPATLASLWCGIDWDRVRAAGKSPQALVEAGIQAGIFSLEDRHLPGMWRTGKSSAGGNVGHCFDCDGTDERSLTQAYLWGRKTLPEYRRFYRDIVGEGYEDLELVATAPLMGVRETRRILGDYVLDVQDFNERASFDDEIGRYSYPVDIHIAKPDKESFEAFHSTFTRMRYRDGESYGIPYRILTPRGLDNLLVAGRCVSTDRSMQASIRVMPGCFITGQAAGIAASVALNTGRTIHDLPVGEVQKRLRDLGAYLPNFEG